MESVIAIVITIVVCAVVSIIALRDIRRIRRLSSDAYVDDSADADVQTTPEPRVSPPSDSSVYTFKTDSKLKTEEWEMLFNAGWELVTSNTETYTDYFWVMSQNPRTLQELVGIICSGRS